MDGDFAALQSHKSKVDTIADAVRAFHNRGEKFRIYHGSTNTTRRTKLDRATVVDTSGLKDVLHVDVHRKTVVVEPNVSMEQLVDATLRHGLLPPVVMEFPAITVGGGFAGTSGESSSFRHGLFEKTITAIEIVLADGGIMQASRTEHEELLHACGGSFGTFGVITALHIDLVEAKQFIELTYTPITSMETALDVIETKTDQSANQYLDGIMFGQQAGVIMSGRLSDAQNGLPVSRFTRATDPWFYLHAEKSCNEPLIQSTARGAFWAGKYSFQYFMMPFNAFTRWLLDPLLRTKVMYHALHKSHLAEEYLVQDIGFPYKTAPKFMDYLHNTFGFYPIWLCPLKVDPDMALHPRKMAAFVEDARSPGMMLNIGMWGPGPRRYEDFILANRDIEKMTLLLGGLKCFYAQAFYTEQEFWDVYDKEWYDKMRLMYDASSLTNVYQKVNVDLKSFKLQWPVKGVYGALQVFLKSDYLLG
ncbi:hypothetical protein AMS68_002773 [Peltaster fructicola]|uniref:Delta(24)-sterol reductase n=1 Tax=Peltaster fructicola TaxID=286661 RepID=A0A6H0XRE0_9PEZI|nr:hypothetical protein AMS68_002773 [Peltaster fructicola]